MNHLRPYVLFLFLCLLGCSLSLVSASPTHHDLRSLVKSSVGAGYVVLDARKADLDHNGVPEIIAITSKTVEKGHPMGGEIVIGHFNKGKIHIVWRQQKMNPWKLQIGDVDGDGMTDIICGVFKKSPKDPVMEKRTFVYYWNGRRLMPKWLGSRLSRRFDDFAVADINHDHMAEIVALERAPGGRHRVSVYRWFSFGFESLGSTKEMGGLTAVNEKMGNIIVTSSKGGLLVTLAGGKVRLLYRI